MPNHATILNSSPLVVSLPLLTLPHHTSNYLTLPYGKGVLPFTSDSALNNFMHKDC